MPPSATLTPLLASYKCSRKQEYLRNASGLKMAIYLSFIEST